MIITSEIIHNDSKSWDLDVIHVDSYLYIV